MDKTQKLFWLVGMIVLLFGSILIGCSSSNKTNESASTDNAPEQSAEEEPADFYKGKKLNFIVPYEPGGGYDEYSRLIAPYLEKYTGAKVEINNMPGAGGMRGVNEIWKAPKDGLSFGIINGSAMVTNQIAEIEGAEYKLGQFSFLGRVVADARVLTMGKESGFATIEDVINSKDTVKMGATGLGGSTYVDAVMTGEALGINQEVIHGFDGSGMVEQAIIRGEVHGMWGSLGSRRGSIEADLVIPVLQSGKKRDPFLPDVPTYFELLESDKVDLPTGAKELLTVLEGLNAVGRPLAAPPGIPQDRLEFLQEAFKQAMEDPEFLEKAEKAERDLSYATGEEMTEIATGATEMSEEIKQKVLKLINGEI